MVAWTAHALESLSEKKEEGECVAGWQAMLAPRPQGRAG